MKKLYLVDVSNMFFRAFYAIPPLTNAKGLPTNALYGFTSMCIRLLRESKPDYLAFCYDRPEASFRSELYDDYKANRTEMPDDLEQQIPYIHQITDLLGIPALDKKGFEADDLIGTLAKKGEAAGLDVIIVSGDKDFAQLVTDKVSLLDTMKNIKYGPDRVAEKWGVKPSQMIDYLALVGDTSDNVPGVRGVGPKGAQKLLAEYGTLDGIYENIEKISGASLKQKLMDGKTSAYLAQKLVTIVCDVKLPAEVDDLKLKPIDNDKLKALFTELEFTAMLRKLYGEETCKGADAPVKKGTGKKKKLAPAAGPAGEQTSLQITATHLSPLQLETWNLADLESKLAPYAEIWASENERGICFSNDTVNFQVDADAEDIGRVLANKNVQWKGFDLKNIWWTLKLKNPGLPMWDNMLAAYVLKGANAEDFEKVCETFLQKKLPDLASPADLLTLQRELHQTLSHRLENQGNGKVLMELELPLLPALYSMEKKGILLDVEDLMGQSKSLLHDITRIEATIYEMAGEKFNIASPKQLGAILFEKLKIPVLKKTKTGYSTDSDVLTKYSQEYPICASVMEYRELTKLKSTYVDALPTLVDHADGRVHTRFHQALTATGRLSSTNPNLQNIPIRTERGRMIRRAFIADAGCEILSIDYSQIELRVLAEITGDPNLTAAFQKDLDIHAATASEIFNVSLDSVTSDQRRMAKAVNFGIAYGQGVFGLAEALGIERGEAKQIIENYFLKFAKVKDYMLDTVDRAKEQGYVETLFGRRRYLDELKSSSQMVRKFGERAAINAPMQGTASDLVKRAMIRVFDSVDIPMLLQVHDELLFECPKQEVEEQSAEIREIMESAADFSVPLKVNIASGPNWDAAH